jgi:N-acetylmuramoyl-L-alanine amidase
MVLWALPPLHLPRWNAKVLHAMTSAASLWPTPGAEFCRGGQGVSAGTSVAFQARRRWLSAVTVTVLSVLAAFAIAAGQPVPETLPAEKPLVIVLDPARGGPNLGGRGPTGLLEKDITLQLAMDTGRLIEELLGVQVVLTRTDDSDVSLDARAALANQVGGNLFISICVGGSLAAARHEFQIFYFDDSQAKSSAAREPAIGGDVAAEGGARRRGAVALSPLILWDQAQLDFLDPSQLFARLLDKNLRAQVAEDGRGIFGLPILLLRWLRMPAVLLDLGAINDPSFEAKLRDDAYLQRAALGIAQAVNDYQALQR